MNKRATICIEDYMIKMGVAEEGASEFVEKFLKYFETEGFEIVEKRKG